MTYFVVDVGTNQGPDRWMVENPEGLGRAVAERERESREFRIRDLYAIKDDGATRDLTDDERAAFDRGMAAAGTTRRQPLRLVR